MSQLIQFHNSDGSDALPNLYHYYLYRKKIGIFVCLTGGMGEKTGAGKSYTGIEQCSITDPRFDINRDVCFTSKQLLQRYDEIEESGEKGRAVMLDEAGIAVASRKWQSIDNEALGENLQTGRYLRTMTFVIAPFFSLIDKNVRKLINFWGTTELVTDGWEVKARLHLYRMKTDILGERVYPKRLTFWDVNRERKVRPKWFEPKLIGPELSEPYERNAKEFKNLLRGANLKKTIKEEARRGVGDVIDSGSLPEVADKMLQLPATLDILSTNGRVDTADVLLLNRRVSPTYAGLIAQMVNKNASKRGLIDKQVEVNKPVVGRRVDKGVSPIAAKI